MKGLKTIVVFLAMMGCVLLSNGLYEAMGWIAAVIWFAAFNAEAKK